MVWIAKSNLLGVLIGILLKCIVISYIYSKNRKNIVPRLRLWGGPWVQESLVYIMEKYVKMDFSGQEDLGNGF